MPTVATIGPYRFFFYAGDRDEQSHIHVERDDMVAKFWLDPVRLHASGGFSRIELRKIGEIVTLNRVRFMEAWHDYFAG
jgi:hypothetical protein